MNPRLRRALGALTRSVSPAPCRREAVSSVPTAPWRWPGSVGAGGVLGPLLLSVDGRTWGSGRSASCLGWMTSCRRPQGCRSPGHWSIFAITSWRWRDMPTRVLARRRPRSRARVLDLSPVMDHRRLVRTTPNVSNGCARSFATTTAASSTAVHCSRCWQREAQGARFFSVGVPSAGPAARTRPVRSLARVPVLLASPRRCRAALRVAHPRRLAPRWRSQVRPLTARLGSHVAPPAMVGGVRPSPRPRPNTGRAPPGRCRGSTGGPRHPLLAGGPVLLPRRVEVATSPRRKRLGTTPAAVGTPVVGRGRPPHLDRTRPRRRSHRPRRSMQPNGRSSIRPDSSSGQPSGRPAS